MSKQIMEAVYEKGVFRPLIPLEVILAEGQKVKLEVEPKYAEESVLELAMQVYKGLEEEDIDEVESIAKNRRNFFSDDKG